MQPAAHSCARKGPEGSGKRGGREMNVQAKNTDDLADVVALLRRLYWLRGRRSLAGVRTFRRQRQLAVEKSNCRWRQFDGWRRSPTNTIRGSRRRKRRTPK